MLVVATQSELDGQDKPLKCRSVALGCAVQALASPVGSVEVAIPEAPAPTQSAPGGHDTYPRARAGEREIGFHALAPAVGVVDVTTSLPPPTLLPPTATHSETDGQETPLRLVSGPIWTGVQAEAPPVGLVEVKIWPERSTATHSDADGQEIPESDCATGSVICVHVGDPLAGSVEVAIVLPPTATHSDREAHDRPETASNGSDDPNHAPAPRAGVSRTLR